MELTNLYNKLDEIGKYVKETYKANLKNNNKIASGKLYNSIDYKLVVTEDSTKLYFLAEKYYIYVENGRRAGKMPPLNAIKKWMLKKGIPDKNGASFRIARSIGKKGIKSSPYLRDIKIKLKNYRSELEEALNQDIKESMKDIVIKYKNK